MGNYLGEEIPKLGFGLMRLPMKDNAIDLEQTKEMVDRFMEAGFCYFDTAYGYNDGESEKAAKAALVDRYPREKFLLATKLPAWAGAKNKEEAEQMFYTSLERTGAGYFDFYLLHNLGEERSHFFDDYGIWDFLQERKKEGLIRHLGFSMHDKAEVLDEILTAHPEMEFVQLQINYADWEDPSIESRKCYEVARKHGKPVIIMEPVKGGTLANPPKEVSEVFAAADPEASPSSWAIRFAASLEGVITVLSGMSNVEQMEDNLSYMKDFKPLTAEEQAVVEKARDVFNSFPKVPCTACAYCMKGCPKNIAIYGTFQAVNIYNMYNDLAGAKGKYEWNTSGHGWGKASECIKCGKCEQVCPQHIHIRDELEKAAEVLEK
ncbi:MAG TPA: aldo/keto reductase [Candidatus Mediterraneibacter excrementigallinarum]|nr:aldo/keto reductase [Candidatus Mediterraneibacter excrementigallinarum]